MPEPSNPAGARRHFLRLLLSSLAVPSVAFATLERLLAAQDGEAPQGGTGARPGAPLLAAPEHAINVMDFEAVARDKLPPAHFGYLATGVDDDATLRANREGFARYQIRPRRLVDVQKLDLSVTLLGTTWDNPIVLAPAGSQRAFHPDGELATARAARAKGHLQMLSTVTTTSVEEVIAARAAPVWYQLYPTRDWHFTRAMLRRVETAGCPVLVFTVDMPGGSNRETLRRHQLLDARQCSACHESGGSGSLRRKPMFDGFDVSKVRGLPPLNLTWDFVKRLQDTTSMKVVLKGIVTREDTELAVAHGVDGLIVSNHGGRAEESGRATIESLPEVLEGAAGRLPVLVDGGFRRGTDIFKALALGATAICIGRPYLWGLAAFGQAGVEAVLEILRRELQLIMRQAGTTSVGQITRAYVVQRCA
jgi:4-hydroxymandelate oxidase